MSNDKITEQPISNEFKEWIFREFERKKGTIIKDNDLFVFELACEQAYRHLHSLPPSPVGESGPKWVKASERWPDKEKRVFYRIEYPDGVSVWCDGHLFPESKRWRDDTPYMEWLDESPNPSRAGEISSVRARGREYIKPPEDGQTYYTYFRLDFIDCGLEYDYTICDKMHKVKCALDGVEWQLDDDTINARVEITGIALTAKEWECWQETFQLPARFEIPTTPAPEVKEEKKPRTLHQQHLDNIVNGIFGRPSPEPVKDTQVEQKVLHCQVYIEDGVSGCSTQCDHCREYYKPFSSPTERPAHVPDIKDILWDELAREYDDLNRMEENSWEWNRNILKQQYTIFRNTQGTVSDTKGEIPEEILQWIIAHPDADYVSIPGKYIGFEPIYWRGVMTLYRTMKGKEKVLTEELAEIKLSFHQAVEEVKRLTTQLSGK